MPRLKAPALSLAASGTLGDALTYHATNRGTIAKKKSKPRDPRSEKQIDIRAVMRWLQNHWAAVSDADRASFAPIAQAKALPLYQAYLHFNLANWKHRRAPVDNPANPWTNFADTSLEPGAFPQPRAILIELAPTWLISSPIYLLGRTTDPLLPIDRYPIIAILNDTSPDTTIYTDNDVRAPNEYFYVTAEFNTLGDQLSWSNRIGAIPLP